MSISVGLELDVSGLQPGDETARTAVALTEFFALNDLDRDVVVGQDEGKGEVSAWTEYPVIVTRFGAWSDRIEQGAQEAVSAVVPTARVSLRWRFEDDDEDF
ncbi:hypothetical protein H9Y04_01945 [Streptomyces sp. TRM66268-LWL]|uniref:Uncharacterized protein n=1 Tax=Streptomyces polyasparticus TaxID=2767826 RepID=A0ABR7S787_9ACTN|nr:hypothetical protein [Streptomyces polyasparticus]MBC9711331.1 hypothetical protein [Streptomyces polyasparticus]